jgi:maltose/moltooligosaccharide transporter
MSFTRPQLAFRQIINMNVGFFGIQYSFGLQQSATNPVCDFLVASPDQIQEPVFQTLFRSQFNYEC